MALILESLRKYRNLTLIVGSLAHAYMAVYHCPNELTKFHLSALTLRVCIYKKLLSNPPIRSLSYLAAIATFSLQQ